MSKKTGIYLIEALNVKAVNVNEAASELVVKAVDNAIKSIKKASILAPDSIMTLIEGIHESGTRNYTRYKPKALKNSVPYWTSPYNAPLILHHNEKNGKIVGRVFGATYVEKSQVNPKVGALQFLCNVSDTEAIKGVKDGRLNTVSIGVIATDIRCSICGEQIELDEDGEATCGHSRGCEYDGETCYWDIYEMHPKELSYVIVPSDSYAQTLEIKSLKDYEVKNTGIDSKESLAGEKGEIDVKGTGTAAAVAEGAAKTPEGASEEKTLDVQLQEKIDELAAANASLTEAQAKNSELSEQVTKLTKDLNDSKTEIQNLNAQIKESVVDRIMDLREKLGKSAITKEELLKRSYNSLTDSLSDLQEDLKASAPKNTEVKENKVETKLDKFKNIKEDKTSISSVKEITMIESNVPVSEKHANNVSVTEKKEDVDGNINAEGNEFDNLNDLINIL